MTATKHKSLVEQVRSGDRKVVVSLFSFGAEKTYSECSFAEARAVLSRKMAKGHSYRLADWQWLTEDGTDEYDHYGDEVDALRTALFA